MERKYYDLSAAQGILFYSQKFTLHKQVNNICTSVLTDSDIDLNLLEQAIKIAYERNDSFRMRIVKVDKAMKQYFAEHEDPVIGHLDFRGKTKEEMERKLYKIAGKRVTIFGTQMSKVFILQSFDGKKGIYFAVSHMIMDSWAITVFFKDILSVYDSLVNKTDLPKPLYPYEELLIKELAYKKSKAHTLDREFWESQYNIDDEPIYTHINGYSVLEEYRKKKKNPKLRFGPFFSLFTKANNIMLPLSKELVGEMEGYCSKNRITMQSMILYALRSYFSKVNKREKDISLYTVIARRGTLKEKNTGGSRVHYMPFRTRFDENMTCIKACEEICAMQSKIYRHAEINPLEVSKVWAELFSVPQLATYHDGILTFQPVKLSLSQDMKIETKWYGNGTISTPIYITVMDGDGGGSLKVYYEYQTHVISFDTIKRFHFYMKKVLKTAIDDEELTIGQTLDL